MAKIKNVVPYVAGIGVLAVGVYLVKKHISKSPKQITLTSPEGEYNPVQQSVKNPELVALEQSRNYIELDLPKSNNTKQRVI